MAHRLQWCASIWYARDVYIRIKKSREKNTYTVYIVCHFTLYNPHNARQYYHWEWNDARFMLFKSTTIIVSSSNNKNNIDDDDIEKIQFATKIEMEREKSIDQLKLLCVERTIAYKFDCLRHTLAFLHVFFYFDLHYVCCNEHEISVRYSNMKKSIILLRLTYENDLACFFSLSFKNEENMCCIIVTSTISSDMPIHGINFIYYSTVALLSHCAGIANCLYVSCVHL